MAKQGTSESQAESQTGDPWQSGRGDPWANTATAANQTHEDNAVPESPMSQSFHAPKEKEEDAKTEEEEAKTDEKGQTVTGDTGARSSQDSTGETKTDQEEKKDVKEKTEVTEKTMRTPDKTTNRALWPTPWQSSWWSSPLQNWYEGGRSAQRGWWSQSQPSQSRWYWQSDGQQSWTAPSWCSTGTWEPEKNKVTKVVMKDTGIVQVAATWWTGLVFYGAVLGVGALAFLAGIGCQSLLLAGGGTFVGAALGAAAGAHALTRPGRHNAVKDEALTDSLAGEGPADPLPLRW